MSKFSKILKSSNLRKSVISKIKRQRSHAVIANSEEVCPYEVTQNEIAKPYSEVPGPKPLPILGNTWRLLPIIGQYDVCDVAKISHLLYRDYGNIVKLSGLIGRPDLLFVYDADEIEKAYRNEGPTPFRPSMPCLVKYKSVVRKDFFGDLPGVVGVHGEPWKEFRSKVQKPILQVQTVKKYIQPVEEVTMFFIKRMMEMKDTNDEMPADFDNEVHKWALECIGRVALDTRLGCLDSDLRINSEPQKIIDAAKYALRNVAILELKFPFWRYFPTTIWRNYVNNMNYFVEICTKYIDEAMIRLQNKKNQDEKELSVIERILANEPNPKTATILALDLILVGIDTISMAVCSILYQLATRPEQQEKMYQELKRVIPDPNTPLNVKLLDEMVFLKAFVKEVFRVYSTVIGNGRTLQKDTVIMGYNIPKGTQVVFPNLVTGVMKEYVSTPDEFIPERWINKNGDYKIHPFASLPYGYGARMCLGRRFADLEIQVLLAKLIRSYKLDYFHQPLEYKITFMYAPEGVQFSQDGGLAVVHEKWLTPRKTEVYWPPCKQQHDYDKLLKCGDEPKDHWQLFSISKLYFESDNFEVARKKIKKLEFTSDIQSDEDCSLLKRKRTAPLRFSHRSSSEDEYVNPKKSSNLKRPPRINLDSLDSEIPTSVNNEPLGKHQELSTLLLQIKEQNNQILAWIRSQSTVALVPRSLPEKFPVSFPLRNNSHVEELENYIALKENLDSLVLFILFYVPI
ncbi:hypothetical protein RN001_003067 [Aquatica leii]|uniref:Cytochrome P450 301a1, mitochondrial n=1 Tax=Aquatica leii TaxID=1421715 RepID=A0AAN7PN63_9COLE|nr:hypothetical protein RN001_003067 [Aquatica leii]